jgi:hypothetical protein
MVISHPFPSFLAASPRQWAVLAALLVWTALLLNLATHAWVPIAPFLPDSLIISDKFAQPYNPRGWTRSIDFPFGAGPFIKNLAGIRIDERPYGVTESGHYPCEEYQAATLKYGMNGAAERFSPQDSHALGNAFGRILIGTSWVRHGSNALLSCFILIRPFYRHMPPVDSGFDVDIFFRVLHTLVRHGSRVFQALPQLRYGYLHGAQVMYVGNLAWHERQRDPSWPRAADWEGMHEVVCQAGFYEERGEVGTFDETRDIYDIHYCYHGIGHAFVYHTYFHPIEVTGSICFEPPPLPLISNLTLTLGAHRMCMTAPTDYYRRACSFGVFHSYSEWTFGWAKDYHQLDELGMPRNSIFYPCDAMSPGELGRMESAMCFDQVFRWLGWGSWVFDEIRAHVLESDSVSLVSMGNRLDGKGKGLASLCLASPWSPGMEEGHVHSCINGLSEAMYLLFDKFAAARSQADLRRAPVRERCCHSADAKCSTMWGPPTSFFSSYSISLYDPYEANYYNMSTYTAPQAHCELLWGGRVLPATHVQNTLVAWCSNFVSSQVRTGEMPLDTREWHRYLACVEGGLLSLSMVGVAAFESHGTLARICPQLLDTPSWVPPTLRRLAHEACRFRFHSVDEPRETRYLKLDGLVDAAWIGL